MKSPFYLGSAMRRFVDSRRAGHWQVLLFSLTLSLSFSFSSAAIGQTIYTPDHPEVKEMADRAVAAIQGGSRGIGETTLAALAIVEHGKRYNQTPPRDNPLVKSTIASIQAMLPPDPSPSNLLTQDECYFPALALILMAETDAKKYQNEIRQIIQMFEDRQRPNGAFTYNRQPNSGDTSQTQFASLALLVAKQHGFEFDPEMPKRALDWLCESQQSGGIFVYKLLNNGAPNDPGKPDGQSQTATLSMQASGLGTVYLLADVLQLNQRAKSMSNKLAKDLGLPRTVTIYVKPLDGENSIRGKQGPLVKFDRGKLNNTTNSGNNWLQNNFNPAASNWQYYYLYALERYAFFREQAEGDMRGMDDWYDETIEFLKTKQNDNGMFTGSSIETLPVATSFAVLFMVRSSEIIKSPITGSTVKGDQGFENDTVIRQTSSGIQSVGTEKDLQGLLEMMSSSDVNEEALQRMTESMKAQIVEFRKKDDKSRGEIKAFLRSMIGHRDYFRRLIAVRFLAGEQDMDNVPALLYALGDPDFRICLEAHNGLRLISRKIDSLDVSQSTKDNAPRYPAILDLEPEKAGLVRVEFDSMKKKWTDWFLKIRPGAELLD